MMKQPQSPFVSLVISAILVSIGLLLTVIVPTVVLWRLNVPKPETVLVPHLSATESNRIAREVFNSFAFDSPPKLDAAQPTDFLQYLQQIEELSDSLGLLDMLVVDQEGMIERVMAEASGRQITAIDRMDLRDRIPKSVSFFDFQSSLKIIHIAPLDAAAEVRTVHAIGYSADGSESREWRFWFTRQGNDWQVVDWQQIDLGYSYAKYLAKSSLSNFVAQDQVLSDLTLASELRRHYGSVISPDAAAMLKETSEMPLQDFDWLRLGYSFLADKKYEEALECARRIENPEEFPGAHRVQQLALFHLRDYTASIEQADAYTALVGKSPEVLLWLGLALHAVGRSEEGDKTLSQIVRQSSWEPRTVVLLTRTFGEPAFPIVNAWLKNQEAPMKAAVDLTGYYHFTDDGGEILEILDSFAHARVPGSAEQHFISGRLAAWNGDHELAYKHFRLAVDSATDEESKQDYQFSVWDAMERLGDIIPAYEANPNKEQMMVSHYWSRRNYESELTEAEWTQLLLQHVQYFPNDPLAVDKLLEYLIAIGDWARAEQEIRQRLEHWIPAQESTRESDASKVKVTQDDGLEDETSADYEHLYESHVNLSDSLQRRFAQVMAVTERSSPAYQEVVDRAGTRVDLVDEFFSELADGLIDLKQWKSLEVLIEQHRRLRPNDPSIPRYCGDLAVHRQQWAEAIEWYTQEIAMASEPSMTEDQAKLRLEEVLYFSDMWRDEFQAAPEKLLVIMDFAETLSRYAPDELERLIEENSAIATSEATIALWMLEIAYRCGNLRDCLKWMKQIAEENAQSGYPDPYIKNYLQDPVWTGRRARIYVRANNVGMARKEARDSGEAALVEALIDAYQGKHADAAAKLIAANVESMSELRQIQNLGWAAFRPEYRELQKRDPFRLESLDSETQWIVYLREPIALDLEQVKNIAQAVLGSDFSVSRPDLGPLTPTSPPIYSLTPQTPGHARWYLQIDSEFHVDPMVRTGFMPEQVAADQARAMIVIGRDAGSVSEFTTFVDSDLAREINTMLHFLETMVGDKAAVWHHLKDQRLVLPSADWKFQEGTNVNAIFREHGVQGFRSPIHGTLGRRREQTFRRVLRTQLLTDDLTKLRVRKTQLIGFAKEPVWLTVQSVEKRCDDLELSGSIASDMVTVAALTAGLPCRVRLSELDAFQIDGQAPVTLADEP